jgi:hypothetical protein
MIHVHLAIDIYDHYSVFTEKDASAKYRQVKANRDGYGPFLKQIIYSSVILPFSALPIVIMYFNVDPTVDIAKKIFAALPAPITQSAFDSIPVRLLLPSLWILIRYLVIAVLALENLRISCLALLSIILLLVGFQDALGFQLELFNKSRRNTVVARHYNALKYVLKYREFMIVLGSLDPVLCFGSSIFLSGSVLLIVPYNYLIVRFCHVF